MYSNFTTCDRRRILSYVLWVLFALCPVVWAKLHMTQVFGGHATMLMFVSNMHAQANQSCVWRFTRQGMRITCAMHPCATSTSKHCS